MRKIVVTAFGVFPAFALCFFLLPASVASIGEYLGTGDPKYLLTLVWCAMGVIGTFALYFSIDRAPGYIGITGLAFGITAMWGLDGFSIVRTGPWKAFFVAPVIIAALLIVEGFYTLLSGNDEPDYRP